ncbi:MAG TPA: STM4015 family protein [Streptomyces sp.]|uniref:STM4015 family protein n=1 Tax=Streptomyces sp. TaxID=1931 RepID=UPI002B6787C9|nr:STM4015 family protein [Streptomyces sp.]HWU09920.1 STM4015 family protein [Streptomyces sp.]
MSDADRLHELLGLPAVDFRRETDGTALPAAGSAAWRISVDPYHPDEGGASWEKEFDAFLEAVDPSGVQALIIGQWGETYEETSAYPVGLVTAAAHRLTSLRAVFVGDLVVEEAEISWIEQSDVTTLLTAFPDLTQLGVRGGTGLVFPPVKHESLQGILVESGGLPAEALRGILGSELPALERLELWLGVSAYGGDVVVPDLAPLLTGARFPRLRHLGLCNSELQNEIAAAVASAPVVAQLHSLDLSNGTLGDEGAAALLEGQPLTHLTSLDLHHHFLTVAMERRIAEALEPHGVSVDLSDRCEPWDNRGAEGRYTAVAE